MFDESFRDVDAGRGLETFEARTAIDFENIRLSAAYGNIDARERISEDA